MTGLFDAYLIIVIFVPGAALVIGLVLLFPQLWALPGKRGVLLGNLKFNLAGFGVNFGDIGFHLIVGIFAAILAGYLINGSAGWLVRRVHTLPTLQVLQADQSLLAPRQKEELSTATKAYFRIDLNDKDLSVTEWFLVTRQMHMRVSRAGRGDRIETFLRAFGLTRNLSLVMFVLAAGAGFRAYQSPHRTRKQRKLRRVLVLIALLALLLGVGFFVIMLNYSELYAYELIFEFIALPRPS